MARRLLRLELLVLGRERVDRRRDDRDPGGVEPLPHERRAREHVGVGLLDVDAQEVPRAARDVVRLVDADVAAPDHARAGALERADEPGGLRVVQDHDVVVVHQLGERAGVLLERALVDLARRLAEVAAVALEAVQLVVEALGDLEELRVAVEHRPAGVDAGALRVAEQREQQLDHAAAARGRVDVPDRARAEQLARGADAVRELLERLRLQDGLEALRRVGGDVDHRWHGVQSSRARVRTTPLARLGGYRYRVPRRLVLTTLSHHRSADSVV